MLLCPTPTPTPRVFNAFSRPPINGEDSAPPPLQCPTPPHPVHLKVQTPRNATSICKVQAVDVSLPLPPTRSVGNNNGLLLLSPCKNGGVTVPPQKTRSNRKGVGIKRERECICVSRNSVRPRKTSVVPHDVHTPLTGRFGRVVIPPCKDRTNVNAPSLRGNPIRTLIHVRTECEARSLAGDLRCGECGV